MKDSDVQPQDLLSLADFAAVYSFFFSPGSAAAGAGAGAGHDRPDDAAKTLSEIAVQVLQEERWRGTPDQTNDLMRRLCAGRSEAVGDCLARVRDAFEALDYDGRGEVSTSDVGALFQKAHISTTSLEHTVLAFTARLDKQARDCFSLPELVEGFGAELQELADASVSVSEAFAMLRMHLPAADVRLAADLALKVRS
jgi:hypothetical protein